MLDSILKKYQGQKYFDFSIEGMSKVLFRLPRFVGWGENTISVGEHSLHVFLLAVVSEPENYELQLYSLVHDFPEAVYNDIPSYAKHNLGDEASVFLKTIDADVYRKLGIDWPIASIQKKVHELDMVALTREAQFVFGKDYNPVDWPEDNFSLPNLINEALDGNSWSLIDNIYFLKEIVNAK